MKNFMNLTKDGNTYRELNKWKKNNKHIKCKQRALVTH